MVLNFRDFMACMTRRLILFRRKENQKNQQAFTLDFKLVKENQKRLFVEASDG